MRETGSTSARQAWMGLLARAAPGVLARAVDGIDGLPGHDWLRAPEIGAVMVRGRIGSAGDGFNLGEMTVTRCALRLASGEVGHGYVQGRDKGHATRAALVDALMQGPRAAEVERAVLAPLRAHAAGTAQARAARAAATKVEFFTLQRGED